MIHSSRISSINMYVWCSGCNRGRLNIDDISKRRKKSWPQLRITENEMRNWPPKMKNDVTKFKSNRTWISSNEPNNIIHEPNLRLEGGSWTQGHVCVNNYHVCMCVCMHVDEKIRMTHMLMYECQWDEQNIELFLSFNSRSNYAGEIAHWSCCLTLLRIFGSTEPATSLACHCLWKHWCTQSVLWSVQCSSIRMMF